MYHYTSYIRDIYMYVFIYCYYVIYPRCSIIYVYMYVLHTSRYLTCFVRIIYYILSICIYDIFISNHNYILNTHEIYMICMICI